MNKKKSNNQVISRLKKSIKTMTPKIIIVLERVYIFINTIMLDLKQNVVIL